jgi:hypothetical protein
MLKLNGLTDKDIGRTVWYVPSFGEPELVVPTSFDLLFCYGALCLSSSTEHGWLWCRSGLRW